MKRWLKPACMLLFLCVLTLLALASTDPETAQLWYNDIRITLNGMELSPKDVNGNTVEPFIIDGTTYLPVRTVAQAVGLDVMWDGNTNTVVLSKPTEPKIPVPMSGFYREKPAPVGVAQAFTCYAPKNSTEEEYSGIITVKKVFRGDEAWALLSKASKANKEPDTEYEYILAEISLTLLKSKGDTPVTFSCNTFSLYDSLGDPYEEDLLIIPPVPCFGAVLSPGETTTGQIAFKVRKDDTSPRILIKSAKDAYNGSWFALTESEPH